MQKKKIFLLDDDKNYLRIAKDILESAGYSVFVSEKPLESFVILKDFQPDCLILDLTMPKVSGDQILPQIRQHFPDLAIILCTAANPTELELKEFNRYGVNFFIQKPVSSEILLNMVDSALLGRSSK